MPNLILPIPMTYESITRHVVQSVVKRVSQITGIPDDIPIRYPGSIARMYQNGTTVTKEEQNQFEHYSKIAITVQEEYREDESFSSPVRYQDMPFIFQDDALGITLKPVYSNTNITINFTYRGKTRAQVERWRDDIRVRLSDNRQAHLHELVYHYPLPKPALVILYHLFTLREKQAGYGETFTEWMKNHLTPHATSLTTMAGTEPLLVVKEQQVGVQGWFDFIEPPEAEKDDGGASWTVNITYRFSYQKPVSSNFKYPLVVHNQFIDEKFYSDKPLYKLLRQNLVPGDVRYAYNKLEDMYEKPADPLSGNRYPAFDEWVPRILPPNTATVATWMIGLDPSDTSLVVDLKDLGDHELVPIFAEFLKKEAPWLTKRGESVVYFTLFDGDMPMHDAVLTIDSDLVVRSTMPLSLRKNYHLRMSFITEFSLLTARARKALLDNGFAAILIFQTLLNMLDADYGFMHLLDYKYLVDLWGGIKNGMYPGWFDDFLAWLAAHGYSGSLSKAYLTWFEDQLRRRLLGFPTMSSQMINGLYHIELPLVGIVSVIADHQHKA